LKNYYLPVLLLLFLPSVLLAEVLKLDYEGFTVWLDCDKRGAVKFKYNATRDTGNHKRYKSFYLDKNVPKRCQQKSTRSYRRAKGDKPSYDRGHLVPANHLDYDKVSIKQSNFMTNILPQVSAMNRGAWLLTEEITECYRDEIDLTVIGGVLWGNDTSDDYFAKSHGVKTPDAYWKVIKNQEGVIAWIIPNSPKAKRSNLDRYLVSVRELERRVGEKLPVRGDWKLLKSSRSWPIAKSCDKS
jgi:endonuclease G, mitochondrial